MILFEILLYPKYITLEFYCYNKWHLNYMLIILIKLNQSALRYTTNMIFVFQYQTNLLVII